MLFSMPQTPGQNVWRASELCNGEFTFRRIILAQFPSLPLLYLLLDACNDTLRLLKQPHGKAPAVVCSLPERNPCMPLHLCEPGPEGACAGCAVPLSATAIDAWHLVLLLVEVGHLCAAAGLVLAYPEGLEGGQAVDDGRRHKVAHAAVANVGYDKGEEGERCVQLEAVLEGVDAHGAQQPLRLLDGAALVLVLLVGCLQGGFRGLHCSQGGACVLQLLQRAAMCHRQTATA